MIELRYFQEDMIEEARVLLRRGVKRILFQAPTGSGKTVLGGHMLKTASDRGYNSWFICHRRELVKQSSATFNRFEIVHGIISAGFTGSRFRNVQVCGLQTLARRHRSLAEPGFIMWDEAHHIAASSWSDIHRAYPNAIHIGLSATPQRLDGTGLDSFFDEMIQGPSISELIEGGYLSDYKLYQPGNLNLAGVHQVAGDYNKKELTAAMNKSTITGDSLAHYIKLAMGKRAIMFEVSIQRSKDAVDAFNKAGIKAEHVDGDSDPTYRDQAMERFIRGETMVLSNVDLFGEGVDVPAVECLIDCAPTMSLTRTMQRWGRVLRPADGKTHAIILDHAGNSKDKKFGGQGHGLPDDDRDWSLHSKRKPKKAKDQDDVGVKTCPLCYSACRSNVQVCKHCNFVFPINQRQVAVVDGHLTEIDRMRIRQEKIKEQVGAESLEDLIRVGRLRGYKRPELWARHVYRARLSKRAE